MIIELEDEAATQQFAEDFALCLRKGDMVALAGDLGAGKSLLARALIRALADDETLEVLSPTFTLAQSYRETRIPLLHADIYRLEEPEEADELGLAAFLAEGIVLLEWPEKAPHILRSAQFCLQLRDTGETRRRLTVTAAPEAEQRLRHTLAIRAFLQAHGRGAAKRRFLQGDASPRAYEKLRYNADSPNGAASEILMDAPPREIGDKSRAAYLKQAHLAADNRQFVAVDKILRAQGFNAPQIYAENAAQTLLILEDFGSDGLIGGDGKPLAKRYLACGEFLAKFHQTDWQAAAQAQAYPLPLYDSAALQAECALLPQWYWPYKTGKTATAAQQKQLRALWQPLFAKLQNTEQSLVLRDFHSPNILWQQNRQGIQRIGLIDFQDAVLGSPAYDLVSLAQDARMDIPPALEADIIEAYLRARAAFSADFTAEALTKAYAILGAQRACKILGVFVRLRRQDGKAAYLRHLPRMADYLQRNLQAPVLRPLQDFFRTNGLI